MRFLDLTLPALADNLALDEVLLLQAEQGQGGEVLRLWEWPRPAVVLGSACRLAEDVEEPACAAEGVPLLRRSSGGGTVLLGAGCLLYSLVLRLDRPALSEIRSSYRFILGRVLEALSIEGAEQAGISDLAIGGLKFSGNAQQRKRHHLLHHGTILYAFELSGVGRFLRQPPRQPEYRANREHDAFVRNVSLGRAEVAERLRAGWEADEVVEEWPGGVVGRLVAEKYGTAEWVRRR